MEFLVVAGDELTRAGARLLAVLEREHRGALLTLEQRSHTQEPGAEVGEILLGEQPRARTLSDRSRARFARHGITFGVHENTAWILADPVEDPSGTLRAMSADLEELKERAEVELTALDRRTNADYEGIHFAGMYLDPYLKVPAQTQVAGRVDFSPARMCWERQYTLGIAFFLADAFDDFALTLAELS